MPVGLCGRIAVSRLGRALVYLRELFVKNSGPIEQLHLELAFTAEGQPIPHLIVGRNGSGKTNLLSFVADALLEGAADVYNDILTPAGGVGRNWFRIVGAKTTRNGEAGSFSILRFEHEGQQLFYSEHAGDFTTEQAQEIVPETLKGFQTWPAEPKNGKSFPIEEQTVRAIYQNGAHAFFPSSRSETPFWLNQKSLFEDNFDTTERYAQNLNKPIYVEHGVDFIAQWLLGILTESRTRVNLVPKDGDPTQLTPTALSSDIPLWLNATQTLSAANQILQAIMGDPQAYFYWAGRRQPRKVGVASGNEVVAAGLDSLSGGQSSLLAVFGTIMRYADATGSTPRNVTGIVVIDELDAHMHIKLQMDAVPKLIAMFPKIQFIISTHSPIFLLGMEKNFPDGDVKIVEMPHGNPLTAEAYDEFAQAFAVLQDTEAFEDKVSAELSASEQPIVWFEGALDERYFKCAAQLLGFDDIIDSFNWIGALANKQGPFNTGDTALNHALALFKANPEFTKRKIVLVYDCDTKKPNETIGNVTVMGLEPIPDRRVQKGVENLLRPAGIPEEMYKTKTIVSDYGETTKSEKLDKSGLCTLLCGENADVDNFIDFEPVLAAIRSAISADEVQTETAISEAAAETTSEVKSAPALDQDET